MLSLPKIISCDISSSQNKNSCTRGIIIFQGLKCKRCPIKEIKIIFPIDMVAEISITKTGTKMYTNP